MHERGIAYRMADANWNRVMEGLRTLEDIARFANISRLQMQYKEIRHGLQRAFRNWDRAELLGSRDAQEDVGRTVKQDSERSRSGGLQDIAASAAGRVEQGLRVLEEVAKYLVPDTAPMIEALRYRTYDLNAELQLALRRDREFLDRAQLYVLADCQLPIDAFVQRVEAISQAGVDLLQIRDKSVDACVLIQYTNAAVDALDRARTRVIVNDRIDIAHCSRAWGGHVGQEDLPPGAARRLLRGDQVLGISTHDLGQIERAMAEGADYLGCGPTFPSQTKSFVQFSGLGFLADAAHFLSRIGDGRPAAFAIGGIAPGNVGLVLEAGFDRIAVSACVWRAVDPASVAATLKASLTASRGGRGR